jgi:hypothetical protein
VARYLIDLTLAQCQNDLSGCVTAMPINVTSVLLSSTHSEDATIVVDVAASSVPSMCHPLTNDGSMVVVDGSMVVVDGSMVVCMAVVAINGCYFQRSISIPIPSECVPLATANCHRWISVVLMTSSALLMRQYVTVLRPMV